LYGTASQGGSGFYGTVFKLNTDGSGFTVLQNLDYYTTGAYPFGGLAQGTDGVLYGTCYTGGAGFYGTVFSLNTDGSGLTVLEDFDHATGAYPWAALTRGVDGNIYGTTLYGGGGGSGTVFRLLFQAPNDPPVARCKDVTVSAGASCDATASIDDGSFDPDAGDSITLTQSPPGPYPLGMTSVTLTVTDPHGATSSCQATVTVTNPPPVATITGPASGSIFAVHTSVAFAGSWTDANGGAHTAQWTFDGTPDGSYAAGSGTSGSANTNHAFTAAGVYVVSLSVTDDCGATGSANQVGGADAMVVVYDPSAGFVTGGGWIDSPAGAYVADPTLVGKANFGFVSKYKKGASVPTGETEFKFKAGDLNFHSTSYDWLVVGGRKAQYKGSGRINLAGDYEFILTCIDGQLSGGGGVDLLRMKITDKSDGGLVYDNKLNAPDSDDPSTALGGGSIVIHKNGGTAASEPAADDEGGGPLPRSIAPADFALEPNQPNPFVNSTQIAFGLPERSQVSLEVFDVAGRAVRTLASGEWEPGRHLATFERRSADGSDLRAGVYFVQIQARSLSTGRSFHSLRKIMLVQ
jgi:uncharacterized repeat protein (TIGR03803 family)